MGGASRCYRPLLRECLCFLKHGSGGLLLLQRDTGTDVEKYEDWLTSKGRGEDRGNGCPR
jgi:hypothetical protein